MPRLALHWQIFIAIAAACVAGILTGPEGSVLGVAVVDVYDFIGSLFLRALHMLVVPLILSSIITGVAGLGSGEGLGRLGLRTIVYYVVTSLLAILVGLLLVDVIRPGIVDGRAAGELMGVGEDAAAVIEQVKGKGGSDLVGIFLRMVPPNVVAAAAEGQMLGLITFAILFGYFMTQLQSQLVRTLKLFWDGVFETMMRITMLVMRFAPLGVFGLVAETVATTGFDAFRPLLAFFFTVLAALALHAFVTLPLLLRFLGGVDPRRYFVAMGPALLTAFSTASSSATLPLTMESVEKNAGVSNRVTSFVLPLGATVNMDGTALYECVAAMFIAQAYGIELGFISQFSVVWIALLTSIGVAGIPAASLVAISVILGAVGLPLEAIGLILVTDRILDMCRTAVNVFSDACGAVIIARLEGEETSVAA